MVLDQLRDAARRHLPRSAIRVLRRARSRDPGPADLPGLDSMSDERFVDVAYWAVLQRGPDPVGRADHLAKLGGGMSRSVMLRRLAESPEAQQIAPLDALMSLHRSRMLFVQSLPPARRILDLGGVSLQSDDGALVSLGYPYRFEHLEIVDLPPEDRHELYRGGRVDHVVETGNGPVSYRYHSMADLEGVGDGSVDLVYSGQTFEHVTPDDGRRVLDEVHRVLRPGGHLALDTPNRAVTAVQLRDEPMTFIDPDHEVEYSHADMLGLFDDHGFVVERAHGLNLCPGVCDDDSFSLEELAAHPGLFADLERCYLLAYVVRRRD